MSHYLEMTLNKYIRKLFEILKFERRLTLQRRMNSIEGPLYKLVMINVALMTAIF